MIKKFIDKDLAYEPSNLSFVDGALVQISGKIEVEKKPSKNGDNMLLKLTDDSGKNSINQFVFPSNDLYVFFSGHFGEKLPCVADIKFVTNTVGDKKYQAMEIHNIHCEVMSEEEKKAAVEKVEENKKSSASQVSMAIKSIEDPLLKRLCINIYKNPVTLEKVMNNPATEHSAYNERYGIINMIADTVNLMNSTVNALNSNFGEGSPKFNLDLMKAGAILCNVGRAYMLEFDDAGNIAKTEENIIDNETLITRDLIQNELMKISMIVNKDGSPAYNVNTDTVRELIHMIVSSKSRLEYNPTMLPKTKHAMLLADIVSMVFTKGLFENLEKSNEGEKFVKAYDGGRSYVMYQ